ncbi:hypothetical protein M231_03617 [Tremella mesenterica]|uniref:C2H2-type domain-containing protein n=1 Tax=Tremella mesenterica TaxID=5217 RepID=A0A4Q1BN52_TREME|nr:hypothetical protein M231_03617 [Tremella mesenterica]
MMLELLIVIFAILWFIQVSRAPPPRCDHPHHHHHSSSGLSNPYPLSPSLTPTTSREGSTDSNLSTDKRKVISTIFDNPDKSWTQSVKVKKTFADVLKPNLTGSAIPRQRPPHFDHLPPKPTFSGKASGARGRNDLSCTRCNRFFVNDVAVRQHFISVHNSNAPICPTCSRFFPDELALGQHQEAVHADPSKGQQYECENCDKKFDKLVRFQQHLQSSGHLRTLRYSTSPTEVQYTGKPPQQRVSREISPGLSKNTGSRTHSSDSARDVCHCDVCQTGFGSEIEMKEHMTKTHPWVSICKTCDVDLNDLASAKRHYLQVHKLSNVDPSRMAILVENLTRPDLSDRHSVPSQPSTTPLSALVPQVSLQKETTPQHVCRKCRASFNSSQLLIDHLSKPHIHQNTPSPEIVDQDDVMGGIDLGQSLPSFAHSEPIRGVTHRGEVSLAEGLQDLFASNRGLAVSVDLQLTTSKSGLGDEWEVSTPDDEERDKDLVNMNDHSTWPSLKAEKEQGSSPSSSNGIPSDQELSISSKALQGSSDRSHLLSSLSRRFTSESTQSLSPISLSSSNSRFTPEENPEPYQQDEPTLHHPMPIMSPGRTLKSLAISHEYLTSSSIASLPTPSPPNQLSPNVSYSGQIVFPTDNPHYAVFPSHPSIPAHPIEQPVSPNPYGSIGEWTGRWSQPDKSLNPTAKIFSPSPVNMMGVPQLSPRTDLPIPRSTSTHSTSSESGSTRSTTSGAARRRARKTWAESLSEKAEKKEIEVRKWDRPLDNWQTVVPEQSQKSRGGRVMGLDDARRMEERAKRNKMEEERQSVLAAGGEDPFGGW